MQACIGYVGWYKKRKALRVIVMQVAEKQNHFRGFLFRQFTPQRNDAGAGIQNDRPLASADFHTGGVPALFDRLCAGRGVASAHAPEFDYEFFVHGIASEIQLALLLSSVWILLQGKFSHTGWEICHT